MRFTGKGRLFFQPEFPAYFDENPGNGALLMKAMQKITGNFNSHEQGNISHEQGNISHEQGNISHRQASVSPR